MTIPKESQTSRVVASPGEAAVHQATAPVPAGPVVYQYEEPEPQPGRCCGCCCDYRIAVMVVCIILCVLEFLVLIVVASGSAAYAYADGTGYEEELDEFMKPYEKAEIAFSALSIVLCLAAIQGARKYNARWVGLNAFWLLVGWIAGVAIGVSACNKWDEKQDDENHDYTCTVDPSQIFVSFVVACLFIYPHIGFMVEVKKGILRAPTTGPAVFAVNGAQVRSPDDKTAAGSIEMTSNDEGEWETIRI